EITAAFETGAAIGGREQAAALRGSQPKAGVVRRLLDMDHLVAGGSGRLPRLAAIFAAEDAFLVAGQEHTRPARIDTDGLRILPMQGAGGVAPGGARIVGDADSGRVGEVHGAGGIAIDGDVHELGNVTAGQDLPAGALFCDAYQAVAGGDVER